MVLAFAGDSTMTSFLVSDTVLLPSEPHHTHAVAVPARSRLRPRARRPAGDHGGGPARDRTGIGMPAALPTPVTVTTRPSTAHSPSRIPPAAATCAATAHGSPGAIPIAASA